MHCSDGQVFGQSSKHVKTNLAALFELNPRAVSFKQLGELFVYGPHLFGGPSWDSLVEWRGEIGSNLVDSASSHTLVSKIKPCTSKYKSFTLKLRMAHYISYSLFDSPLLFG